MDYAQEQKMLLVLLGFCGEFPMSLLARYPGYYDYNRRIVTSLVREGYLKERKFRDYDDHVVRSLSLTKKGIRNYRLSHPEVKVTYTVALGDRAAVSSTRELTLKPGTFDYETLKQNLRYLPELYYLCFEQMERFSADVESKKAMISALFIWS